MIQTESRTIDGHVYHVRQLGATKGRAMLVRLTRVLGPVLGALLEGHKSEGPKLPPKEAPAPLSPVEKAVRLGRIMEADGETIARTLRELAGRLQEADLEYIVREFGVTTQLEVGDDRMVPLDTQKQEFHFAGRYASMFKWIGFCLEVNYRDFFSASGSPKDSPNPEAGEGSP